MKHVTVEEIRAAFPNPVKACEAAGTDGTYCVLGAYVLASQLPWKSSRCFPYGFTIVELCGAENKLEATELAHSVEIANDAGDFELAWQELGNLLAYLQSEQTPCTN